MIASYEYRSDSIVTSPGGRHTIEYPLLIHQQIEYIYISKGSAVCNVDNYEMVLNPGEMVIVFPYIPHRYKFIDAEYYMVMFDPNLCSGFNKSIKASKPEYPYLSGDDSKILSEILLKAYQAHRKNSEFGDEISRGYINALVGETLQMLKFVPNKNEDSDVLARILKYCNENFKNNINIEVLSRSIGISQKYCSNVISSRLNQNFREYINTLRMLEATKLLKSTEHPITYIAFEVGYKNQSTFNRVFLDFYGTTPSAFRVTKQNKQEYNRIFVN